MLRVGGFGISWENGAQVSEKTEDAIKMCGFIQLISGEDGDTEANIAFTEQTL